MSAEENQSLSDSFELEESQEILFAIARLANRFVDDVAKRYVEPVVDKAEKIREILGIRSADHEYEFLSILAVDSTWTRPFVELVVGDIAVIATGYIITTPVRISSQGIAYIGLRRGNLDSESRFGSDVELDAKIMEFYTAWSKMKHYIELVMLDGSLFFSTIPEFFSPANVVDIVSAKRNASGPRLASIASTALLKMLRRADTLNIPVVGVVKRVASRFLLPTIDRENLRDIADVLLKTNDKFLLSILLKPGEYIVVDSYLEALKQYLSYMVKRFSGAKVKRVRRVLQIVESCSYTEEEPLKELCKYMDNTAVVYYRQFGDAVYPQVTRLDVYPKTAVENIVRYAVYNSSQNCVPIPIDYIDRYIRLESTLIKRVYGVIKSYIKSPATMTALSPTNPQKYYLFEYIERSASNR